MAPDLIQVTEVTVPPGQSRQVEASISPLGVYRMARFFVRDDCASAFEIVDARCNGERVFAGPHAYPAELFSDRDHDNPDAGLHVWPGGSASTVLVCWVRNTSDEAAKFRAYLKLEPRPAPAAARQPSVIVRSFPPERRRADAGALALASAAGAAAYAIEHPLLRALLLLLSALVTYAIGVFQPQPPRHWR